MTMTRMEVAVVDGLKNELALEKALGWPRFKKPTPLPITNDLKFGEWQPGWWVSGSPPFATAVLIERDGCRYRTAGASATASCSQGCPPIYATPREALEALAWDTAAYCANLMRSAYAQMEEKG